MLANVRKSRHEISSCALVLLLYSTSPVAASEGLRSSSVSKEIIFLDPSVRNHQQLLAGIDSHNSIVTLEPDVPLLSQIADRLHGERGVTAIHVIAHGMNGTILTLGSRLDETELQHFDRAKLNLIKQALAPSADLLLYGCNLASDEKGQHFVQALSSATGMDVAASINDTGHAERGADWTLEYEVGAIETSVFPTQDSQDQWRDILAVGITVANNTSTLINSLGPLGMNGVSYTGTPSIFGSFSSNAYGTFTTSGSNLGMTSGAIFGTGNITQISGSPSYFWDGPGTGVTSGSELDRAALLYSFIPDTGVTKVVFRYILGSEEYNEYVGQNFSDNITIRLTGGIYSATNVATVPGTSTGIDIDTINAGVNSAYYRDNTIASPPVPDSVLDGHTTALKSVTPVVPGTTYAVEIKVADFTDNLWNTALFVDYFGASLQLDLDSNDSSGAALANYQNIFTEGGAAVTIADSDRTIINFDGTSIQSATITLTNAKAGDSLTFGSLPSGITGAIDNSVAGVIKVTLSGTGSIANYQTALSTLRFANSSNVPNTQTRNITVVVNDGVTNSNTATSSISVNSVPTYLYTVAKSVSASAISSPGTLNYVVTLVNTGDGNMTGVTLTDSLTQSPATTPLTLTGPTGDGSALGQFDVGETWTYSAAFPVTQLHMDNGNNLVNTVTVTSSQTSPTTQIASATTTITKSPSLVITKTANTAGPVSAGDPIVYSYLVRNAGNITVNNINISDAHNGSGPFAITATETLVSDSAPAGDSTDSTLNGVWEKLAPGDEVRFSANYTVVQADVDTLQ